MFAIVGALAVIISLGAVAVENHSNVKSEVPMEQVMTK